MAGSKGKGSRSGYQKRQRSSLEYIMSPFYEAPSEYDALVKDYRTLAKAADTRLTRLEKYSTEEWLGHATDYAYRRAMRDIKVWSGEDATRFNRKPPEGIANLKRKMQDIKTFLSMETTTKKGLKAVEQKRADTLNKRFGTNFTPKEIGKFFDSKLRKKMDDKILDSNTMVKTIAVMRRNKDIILQTGVSRKKKMEQLKKAKKDRFKKKMEQLKKDRFKKRMEQLKKAKKDRFKKKMEQLKKAEKDRFKKQVKEANERDIDAPDEMVESLIDLMLQKHSPTVRSYLKGSK